MKRVRRSKGQASFATLYNEQSQDRILDLRVPCLPLGLKALDDFFGGGLPLGKLIEIFGGWGEGKTLIALLIASLIMKNSVKDVLLIDTGNAPTETSLFQPLKDNYGKRFGILEIHAFETLDRTLESFLTDPNLVLVIIDALAGLRPKQDLRARLEDIHPELKSRMEGMFLMKYKPIAAQKKCTFLFMNEMRARGEWGSGERWLVDGAGTKVARHAMDQRIRLRALPGSWEEPRRQGEIELKALKDRWLGNRSAELVVSYPPREGSCGETAVNEVS